MNTKTVESVKEKEKKSAQSLPQTISKEEMTIIGDISPRKKGGFPIIGIGSSAGGIKALGDFFRAMPDKTGMAFIIIQHMSPTHKSLLPQLIQRITKMVVLEAKDGQKITPDHVYVTPSNKNLYINRRSLKLIEKPEHPYVPHSIDLFFRSMAESLKDKAIGIILSGSGSDGAFGARLINQKLGMVIAQNPDTAQFSSMPRSVILAGVADNVLSPEQMPEYLINYARLYYRKPAKKRWEMLTVRPFDLQGVFSLVQNETGYDLSIYKLSTIYRRVERRMGINQINKIEDYIQFLNNNPAEVNDLVKFFLTSITRFFQEPQAYTVVKSYLKKLLLHKPQGYTIRVWSLGCATGEEVYSLAIIVRECIEELKKDFEFMIFATDIDKDSINLARTAIYPSSIASEDVSHLRLEKFFDSKDSYYQVKKELRSRVLFSVDDYLSHKFFTNFINLDLVSIRGIAPYLKVKAHHNLIPLLHNSLNPGGVLFLGIPDTMNKFTGLFNVVDHRWSIYERRDGS